MVVVVSCWFPLKSPTRGSRKEVTQPWLGLPDFRFRAADPQHSLHRVALCVAVAAAQPPTDQHCAGRQGRHLLRQRAVSYRETLGMSQNMRTMWVCLQIERHTWDGFLLVSPKYPQVPLYSAKNCRTQKKASSNGIPISKAVVCFGRNPAPSRKPWNDDSLVNTNKQWFRPWF